MHDSCPWPFTGQPKKPNRRGFFVLNKMNESVRQSCRCSDPSPASPGAQARVQAGRAAALAEAGIAWVDSEFQDFPAKGLQALMGSPSGGIFRVLQFPGGWGRSAGAWGAWSLFSVTREQAGGGGLSLGTGRGGWCPRGRGSGDGVPWARLPGPWTIP